MTRRKLIVEAEKLKRRRNEVSHELAILKREKKDADHLISEMRKVGEKIKVLDEQLTTIEEVWKNILLGIPNIPHESVPVGETEDENVKIRKWGEKPQFGFEPKPHWDIATELDIIDFERAGKITGSRFAFYKGLRSKA